MFSGFGHMHRLVQIIGLLLCRLLHALLGIKQFLLHILRTVDSLLAVEQTRALTRAVLTIKGVCRVVSDFALNLAVVVVNWQLGPCLGAEQL